MEYTEVVAKRTRAGESSANASADDATPVPKRSAKTTKRKRAGESSADASDDDATPEPKRSAKAPRKRVSARAVKTKKQKKKEAEETQRALTSFGSVWGSRNHSVADGIVSAAPEGDEVVADDVTRTSGAGRAGDDDERIASPVQACSSGDEVVADDVTRVPVGGRACDDDERIAPPARLTARRLRLQNSEMSEKDEDEVSFDFSGGVSDDALDDDANNEAEGVEAVRDDAERGYSTSFQALLQDASEPASENEEFDYDGYEASLQRVDPIDPNATGLDDGALESDSDGDDVYFDDLSDIEIADDEDSDGSESDDGDGSLGEREIQRVMTQIENSSSIMSEDELREMSRTGWVIHPENTAPPLHENPTDKNYAGYCGLSQHIYGEAVSPIRLFYYFLPRESWLHVASKSNRYWRQTFDHRVDAAYERSKSTPNGKKKSRHELESQMSSFRQIFPHEVVQYIGLLLAHVLSPHKRLNMHWAKDSIGAVPSGTFGEVMSRARFEEVARFLHFSDNNAPQAARDRAWKIRPVLETIQRTFKQGYVLGYHISLDEGMLPCRNRHNPTRQYMKDKPHKWGTKCVLTCCAITGYCKRVELDVGTKQHRDDGKVSDTKSGPAAAIRNIAAVFRGEEYQGRRLLITDRYYTSVTMVQQLRTMGFNFVGTIQKNRLGWCHEVEYPAAKRPKTTPRGVFKMATAHRDEGLTALGWMDNRPVYFLSSHVPRDIVTIKRREKNGDVTSVPCPRMVKIYQDFMSGVDKHDQLRLQSYSIQLCTRFRKYYKSLFLGLVDMVLVNCYIAHNLWLVSKRKQKIDHAAFFYRLQAELVATTPEDFSMSTRAERGTPVKAKSPSQANIRVSRSHTLKKAKDKRENDGQQRIRQRVCKVCSVYKGEKTHGYTTTFYCESCSRGKKGLTFLCNRVRDHAEHRGLTCSQIWHAIWKNGEFAPKKSRDRACVKTVSRGQPDDSADSTFCF